jgi:hypothetical protein
MDLLSKEQLSLNGTLSNRQINYNGNENIHRPSKSIQQRNVELTKHKG